MEENDSDSSAPKIVLALLAFLFCAALMQCVVSYPTLRERRKAQRLELAIKDAKDTLTLLEPTIRVFAEATVHITRNPAAIVADYAMSEFVAKYFDPDPDGDLTWMETAKDFHVCRPYRFRRGKWTGHEYTFVHKDPNCKLAKEAQKHLGLSSSSSVSKPH